VRVVVVRSPAPFRTGGAIGVAIASLALASCINVAPAVTSQASTVDAARSVDLVFADVTGDGSDDVIVAVSLPGSDAVVRMLPCGGGCLERREQVAVGGDLGRIDAGDFDGDGVEDVAVATSVDARVYFGGTATAGRPEGLVAEDLVVAAVPEFEPWSRVVAGDFDDDGDADIGLVANASAPFAQVSYLTNASQL
jgi:hypothetical protein